MEKSIVCSGKNVDLAIEAALTQLGLDRDSVSVQVLQREKSGFLGFGAQPAKVQVTYEVADPVVIPEEPKVALSSASRSKKPAAAKAESKPAAPVRPAAPAAVEKPAENAPERGAEKTASEIRNPRPAKRSEPRPERRNDRPRAEKPAEQPKAAPRKPYTPAAPGSTEEKIESFLKGLLENMGSAAVPQCTAGEDNTYNVELVGEDLGYLIGRRGDTLDAIQHLANYSVSRGVEGHIRINVDAESYREKREESLRRYARKKAQQVLKNRRRTTLEPMNAYERHVIHATLQEMDNITTHSTGVEPNRCVVIEYVR